MFSRFINGIGTAVGVMLGLFLLSLIILLPTLIAFKLVKDIIGL